MVYQHLLTLLSKVGADYSQWRYLCQYQPGISSGLLNLHVWNAFYSLEKRKEYKFSKKLESSYTWKEGKAQEISCEVNEALQDVVWYYNGTAIAVSVDKYCSRALGLSGYRYR